jgi:hypothetical protein
MKEIKTEANKEGIKCMEVDKDKSEAWRKKLRKRKIKEGMSKGPEREGEKNYTKNWNVKEFDGSFPTQKNCSGTLGN